MSDAFESSPGRHSSDPLDSSSPLRLVLETVSLIVAREATAKEIESVEWHLEGLELANSLCSAASQLVELTVDKARDTNHVEKPVAWAAIGEVFGITRQAAHTRYTENGREKQRRHNDDLQKKRKAAAREAEMRQFLDELSGIPLLGGE